MPLDETDRAILIHLESDSRIPISHLARKVGLSKDGAAYRIRALERKGAIRGYYAMLNRQKLGLVAHRAAMRLQNVSPEVAKRLIGFLEGSRGVVRVASCEGRWDIVFVAWSSSTYEFDGLFTGFLGRFGAYVQEKELSIITESHYCKRKHLGPAESGEAVCSGPPSEAGLDEIDGKIVRLMAENARIRIRELSGKVGLVPDAVAHRVESLLSREVILGFRPALDPGSLGCQEYDVMVRLSSTKRLGEIFSHLKSHKNVLEYHKHSGPFDFGMRIEAGGPDNLREIISGIREKFRKEIADCEPLRVYRLHKDVHHPFF